MTEKELHKLSRQDLLQLLLAQSKEVVRQKASIEDLMTAIGQERELTDRLKAKLNEKDETIEHLKHRLDAKDETMKTARILDLIQINMRKNYDAGFLVQECATGVSLDADVYGRHLSYDRIY